MNHKKECTILATLWNFNLPIKYVTCFGIQLRKYLVIFDHPRSNVVYNFGRVCMYVCQTITFESLDVRSSFSHIRISRENTGQVRIRKSSSQGQGHRSKKV